MRAPKGCVVIEFGQLNPGDEFTQPEDPNTLLVKRSVGSRWCRAEPTGLMGPEKMVFTKRGTKQLRLDTSIKIAEDSVSSFTALIGVLKRLRGTDPDTEGEIKGLKKELEKLNKQHAELDKLKKEIDSHEVKE